MIRPERSILWLDIETTGLDPGTHEIIEIAVVLTDFSLSERKRLESKVLPAHIETASAEALKINGYDAEIWAAKGRPLASVIGDIAKMIPYKERAIPAGHNIVGFDLPFLRAAFKATGKFCPLSYWALDTYPLAVSYMVQSGLDEDALPNLKLTTLSDHFGVKHDGAHTALADAIANIEVYRRMVEQPRQSGSHPSDNATI